MTARENITLSRGLAIIVRALSGGIIGAFACVVGAYLAFAFASWELNPGHWDDAARAFCAFIASAGAALCLAKA